MPSAPRPSLHTHSKLWLSWTRHSNTCWIDQTPGMGWSNELFLHSTVGRYRELWGQKVIIYPWEPFFKNCMQLFLIYTPHTPPLQLFIAWLSLSLWVFAISLLTTRCPCILQWETSLTAKLDICQCYFLAATMIVIRFATTELRSST